MPTLFLVRHGETDWNRSGQIMGARPVPLNPRGQAQAQRVATLLQSRPLAALLSSPVARALETAEILSTSLGVPVTVEQGVTEIGVGEWEGLFWKDVADEIVKQNWYGNPRETRFPGGETLQETQIRAVAAVEHALARKASAPVLFVSHADVIRAVVAHFLGLHLSSVRQIRIDNGSLTAFDVNGTLADLLFLNHIPDRDL